MVYYPVSLDLKGKKAVVIGGGKIAQRKITGLIEAEADITVVSPELTAHLHEFVQAGKLMWKKKVFSAEDIQGAFLIIAASNDPEVNLAVKKLAVPHQLISLADHSEQSNFILPSVVKRGKLSIAISTSGASPILAKKIKSEIADRYGSEYKDYVDFLFTCRKRILAEVQDPKVKQALLSSITELAFLHSRNRDKDFTDLLYHHLHESVDDE